MRKPHQFRLTVCLPETDTGREALGTQLAQIYADTVIRKIRALPCPAAQKLALLDAVICNAKKQDP